MEKNNKDSVISEMDDSEKQQYTVGVDLGGTNTQYAVVDASGYILMHSSFKTCEYPHIEDFADKLADSIEEMILATGTRGCIKGIGIGAPCVNARMRCIDGATDLPWHGTVPLAEMIESHTGLHVEMSNDANSAAIGEMIYGCAKGMSDFIMLTLGTGVGSGIVCDGRILNGKRGFAGELGHVTFPFAADRVCGCGRRGCLQTICSSKGMVSSALRLIDTTDIPSSLRNLPIEALTAKAIGDASLKGDPIAKKVMYITEEALGKACAEFVAMTDPEAIVFFGGPANPKEMDVDHITEVMEENMLYIYKGKVKILFSRLHGAEAALLGAASLPWQKCQPI